MIRVRLARPEIIMKRYEKPTLAKAITLQTIVAVPSLNQN
jgi:hypothetical protein